MGKKALEAAQVQSDLTAYIAAFAAPVLPCQRFCPSSRITYPYWPQVFVEDTGLTGQLTPEQFLSEREAALDEMFPQSTLMPGAICCCALRKCTT